MKKFIKWLLIDNPFVGVPSPKVELPIWLDIEFICAF
jgi:hypothetical protein